jgi:hypothetical protein
LYRIKDKSITQKSLSKYFDIAFGPPSTPLEVATSTKVFGDCKANVCIALKQSPNTNDISERSCSPECKVKMDIVRLVNHVPLPDNPGSIACGICMSLGTKEIGDALEVFLSLVFDCSKFGK